MGVCVGVVRFGGFGLGLGGRWRHAAGAWGMLEVGSGLMGFKSKREVGPSSSSRSITSGLDGALGVWLELRDDLRARLTGMSWFLYGSLLLEMVCACFYCLWMV